MWILLKYYLVQWGDKMIWQLCDNSFEIAFKKQFTISIISGFRRCPCPIHAQEHLTGIDCIQDVGGHEVYCVLTFGRLLSSYDLFLQPVSQHVGLVACISFTGQLVEHDHPTLREGLRALLAIQVTWKYDQVLIHLPQYLRLVSLVGYHPEFGWLLYPFLQDIPQVGIVAR